MDKLKYGETMTIEEAIEILKKAKELNMLFPRGNAKSDEQKILLLQAIDVAISVLLEQKDIYKNKDNCKYNYDCEHCGYSECIKIKVCRKEKIENRWEYIE